MPVYKQPNSKNWLIEFKVDGKRFRRSSGTNIKRKAKRLEEKWRQEIYDGALLDAPEIDDRFDAALDALLAPEAYTGLAAAFVDRVLAGEA